jgi:hypothetical protein
MGKILTLKPEDLRITQDYLIPKHVKRYLNSVDINKIPPIPIVQDGIREGYSVIEGHHFLASLYLRGRTVTAWLCESPKDLLQKELFPYCNPMSISARNKQIRSRYNSAPFYVPMLHGTEIFTIAELINESKINV